MTRDRIKFQRENHFLSEGASIRAHIPMTIDLTKLHLRGLSNIRLHCDNVDKLLQCICKVFPALGVVNADT